MRGRFHQAAFEVGRCALQDFEYIAAKSIDEIVSLLKNDKGLTRVLSGGTDLLVQLREGRVKAERVVAIKHISEVNELIFHPINGLTIGAAVSCRRICSDPMVASGYPGLVDAFSLIGGTQIQGRASIGGNLCNASPAADSIPALIAHRAFCLIAGPHGVRELPVEHFCIGPGRTALKNGEFLLATRVPPVGTNFGAAYLRFIPRKEMDIAVIGVGASVNLSGDSSSFVDARIALGAVAPTPLHVKEAGEFLVGRQVSDDAVHEAAIISKNAAKPISDMRGTAEQRRHLTVVLTRRALSEAIARAQRKNGGLPNPAQ